MFGWLRLPAALASCSNRRRRSGSAWNDGGRILIGDVALQLGIARAIDLAHPAGAECPDDLEAAEPIARGEIHGREPALYGGRLGSPPSSLSRDRPPAPLELLGHARQRERQHRYSSATSGQMVSGAA